jgi:hypothetical protein
MAMRTVTYWIPAACLADAGTVARAVHRKAAPLMPWHRDEAACQRRADECNALLGARQVRPFAVVIEERSVDDGRIVNAWRADAVGKVAASIAFLYAGCWLVGWGTLL